MHPAISVILLTTLIGVGQGLFVALYATDLLSFLGILPKPESPFFSYGSALVVLFLMGGLLASFFHLGHPERAWRAAAMWKTSWLSREVIALPLAMFFVFVYGVLHYNNPQHEFLTLGYDLMLLITGGIGVVAVFLLFLCTGMIYACLRFLQEWATPLTIVNFTLLGLASGCAFTTAFAVYYAPELVDYFANWTVVLTLAAFITRAASLMRNSRIKYKSNLQSAIGIRHNKITQRSQGLMGGSFNTREFFHGMSLWFMQKIKWTFLILVFPIPVALLLAGIFTHTAGLFFAAFVVQYLGLLCERWFFFAQANHPQNLYYQTIS